MTEPLDHLIKKGSYFYRANKSGYTSFKFDAGRYTKADAEAEASVEPWNMKALHQDDVPDDTDPDRYVSELKAEIAELRAKLFPYADATEIGGISWDGKYLIGDKASIRFFHEMKNRGEQIDVYKRAYDQNLAAKDAEIERLRSALQNIIREDDTGPMTFESRANGPAQAIGGSEGKFAAIARAALNGGSDAP